MGSPLKDTLKNKADNKVDIVNHSVDVSDYTETGLKQLEMLQQILAFKEQCKDIPLDFNTKALEYLLSTINKIKETFIDLPKLLEEINNKGILLSGSGIEDVKKDIQNLDNIINNLGKDGIFGDKAIEEASKFASILDSVKIKIDTIKNGENKNLFINNYFEQIKKFYNTLKETIGKTSEDLIRNTIIVSSSMEKVKKSAKIDSKDNIFNVLMSTAEESEPRINKVLQDIQKINDTAKSANIGINVDTNIEDALKEISQDLNNSNNNSLNKANYIARQKINELIIGYANNLKVDSINTDDIKNLNIVGQISDNFYNINRLRQEFNDSIIADLNKRKQDLENQLNNTDSDTIKTSIENEINDINKNIENFKNEKYKSIQLVNSQYNRALNQYSQPGNFDMNAYDSVGAIKSTSRNTNKSFEHLYKSVSDMNILSGTDANKDIDKILGSKNVDLGSVIKSTKSALGSTKFLSDRLDNGRIMGNIQKAKETGDTELLKQSITELKPVIDEFDKLKTVAGNLSDILKIDANGNKEIEALQKAVRQVLNNILSFGLAIGETRDSIKETINDLDEGSLKEELKNELKNVSENMGESFKETLSK